MKRKNDDSTSLTTSVYQQFRDKMMALEIKPGSRLIEEDIAKEMGVGRTPVREALLRLQGEGLLKRSGGWVVLEIEPSMVDETFECRLAIEGYATRLAAERATEEDIAGLRAIAELMASNTMSRVEENKQNRLFHETIVKISGNKIFHQIYERTQFPYWNLRTPVIFFSKADAESVHKMHSEIIDAIAARDADKAERLAREHIQATFHIVREALMQ